MRESKMDHREEKDSMGTVLVPKEAYYGAQTQRAVENFTVSGLKMPAPFIKALGFMLLPTAGVT
ncbi:aspartate ammonia-lyase, partial [Thermodesulfobacteriota bacterium]